MNKYTKIVLMAALFAASYLITLQMLTPPYVKIFNGATGVTVTDNFKIEKPNWDIILTYFKYWGVFWSLRVEVYKVGSDETPVFSTMTVLYRDIKGEEHAELVTHHSLPPGQYYLKIYSENTNWTIKIVEW